MNFYDPQRSFTMNFIVKVKIIFLYHKQIKLKTTEYVPR